jgi:hypothetical protein
MGNFVRIGEAAKIVTALNGSSVQGRRYVLDSGDAIATYCPADGSVVAVDVGDQLYDGNTGLWLTAMTAASNTEWVSPSEIEWFTHYQGYTSSSFAKWIGEGPSRRTRLCWLIGYDGHTTLTAGTTGTNYFDVTLNWKGAQILAWTTKNQTNGVTTRNNGSIDTILDYSDLDGGAGVDYGLKHQLVERGVQAISLHIRYYMREVYR